MHDFIFISVPKTATKSIHAILDPYQQWKHERARDIQAQVPNWEQAFTFGFVRNPFERLVSWFFYQKQDGSHRDYDRFETFASWVKAGCPDHWTAHNAPSPLTQYTFFTSPDNTILVDFIGRFENLNADFAYVCRQIGIAPRRLPLLNRSSHQGYRSCYDDEMIAIVRQLFAKDLAMFQYDF